MHHFAYRDGVLHAEAVDLRELAEAVGTPFYCYSTATLDAALSGLRRSLRRRRRARLLRDEGQFQPGGDRDAGAARRRRRRGVGRRAAARAGGRHSAGKDHVLRRRQDRSASSRLPSSRAFSASTLNRSRSSSCLAAIAAAEGPRRRYLDPRQSRHRRRRPTPRSRPARPRTSSAFRSAARARSMRRAAKLRGVRVVGVDMHIGSQITELDAVRRRLRAARRFRARAARRRPRDPHVDLGGGLGIPYREDNEPPPDPAPMRRWSSARRATSAAS